MIVKSGLRLAMALLTATVLTACAGLSASPESPIRDHKVALEDLSKLYTGSEVVACMARPLADDAVVGGIVVIPAGTVAETHRACRDRIVQAFMTAIDLGYADFEIAFFNANRYGNFGATLVSLGLSSAGALTSSATTQILSAINAAVTGGREAFNREVLADQTAAALLTAMRSQRISALLRIREGLGRSSLQYPLGVALSDVYAYFRAGTVPGALTAVTQAVGTEAKATEEQLRNAVPVAQNPWALALRRMLGGSDLSEAERTANFGRVRAAMTAEGIEATVSVSDFVTDAKAEKQQFAVLRRVLTP